MEITKGENANLAGMEPRCPKCENEKLHIGQGDGRFWVTCTNGHATEVPLDFEISHFAQFFRSPAPTPPLDVQSPERPSDGDYAIYESGRWLFPLNGFLDKYDQEWKDILRRHIASPAPQPSICDGCGAGLMLDRGTFYDCFACGHNREKKTKPAASPAQPEKRPKIICLCGSTRFIEQFAIQTWELELKGHIVLGCTLLPSWYCPVRDHFAETLGVKDQRDNHHLQKIDLADEVLVLNIGGYIGESTRNEIAYAEKTGKPVKYLEPLPAPPQSGKEGQ